MTKRNLLATLLLLLFSGSIWAASTHDCGPYVLRHRVLASTNLSPASANLLGVEVSPSVGIINIMLLNKASGKTLSGRVHVVIKRASGLMRALKLRMIESEEESLFYAAEFQYAAGEKIDFELSVSALGQPPQAFSFSQTLP